MKTALNTLLVAALTAGSLHAANLTKEEALKIVTPFYQFMSGQMTPEAIKGNFDPNWRSYFGHGEEDYRNFAQTTKFMGGPFRKMVPDLKWEIIDTKFDGNTIIIHGEGSGTVAGDTFITSTVKPGSSFKMMSIDMHTIENGKVVKTYHIEDWRTAFKQLGIVAPFDMKKWKAAQK